MEVIVNVGVCVCVCVCMLFELTSFVVGVVDCVELLGLSVCVYVCVVYVRACERPPLK